MSPYSVQPPIFNAADKFAKIKKNLKMCYLLNRRKLDKEEHINCSSYPYSYTTKMQESVSFIHLLWFTHKMTTVKAHMEVMVALTPFFKYPSVRWED